MQWLNCLNAIEPKRLNALEPNRLNAIEPNRLNASDKLLKKQFIKDYSNTYIFQPLELTF